MPRKLLQWLGVLFVLGLLGASVGGLMVLKDRIRLVVQLDAAAQGPDPLALLRDDLQVLQRELGEVRTALGGNFERLGTALEERADARHAEVLTIGQNVAAVQSTATGQAAVLARLGTQLADVERRLAGLGDSVAMVAAQKSAGAGLVAAAQGGEAVAKDPVQPPPSTTPVEPAVPAPVVAAPTPEVAPPVTPPAAPAAKKGKFLSFSVPESKFQFTEAQDYVLAADLCRVGFDAKSTLHDFTGVSTKVAGQFRADFDDPAGAWTGAVTCDVKGLATGVEGRDTGMFEHLDAEHHPLLRFTIARFAPTRVDGAAMTAEGTVHGQMTIRGKARDVQMPVKVSVDAGTRVVVEGQMPLKLSDYEIPVPSQLGGAIAMQDEVSVWIALRARLQAPAGGAK